MHEEGVSFVIVAVDEIPVHTKIGICYKEGDPLVAAYESIVIRKAFHKRGGFLNKGVVISKLAARGLESLISAKVTR